MGQCLHHVQIISHRDTDVRVLCHSRGRANLIFMTVFYNDDIFIDALSHAIAPATIIHITRRRSSSQRPSRTPLIWLGTLRSDNQTLHLHNQPQNITPLAFLQSMSCRLQRALW